MADAPGKVKVRGVERHETRKEHVVNLLLKGRQRIRIAEAAPLGRVRVQVHEEAQTHRRIQR